MIGNTKGKKGHRMSYKKVSILSSILLSICLMPSSLLAAPDTNMADWDKLVDDVKATNPSLFRERSKKSKRSSDKDKSESSDSDDDKSKDELKKEKDERKSKKEERKRKKKLTKKLRKAVKDNDYEKVKEYVLGGADTSYSKKNGLSLLHIAAANGNIHIVRVLETHGADLNATTIKRLDPPTSCSTFWTFRSRALFNG